MAPSHSPQEPIAIVGSGCRLPGACSSPSKLWQLLREPRDLQTEIPSSRFNPDGFYHPDNSHHGTSNVRHSYLLEEDYRHFDAQFFGIKPAEAHCIDPQHRLLLETVYESLESAGLRLEDLRGSETAVYVGLMCGDYADIIVRDPESFPTYLSTGTARSLISNRISYFFDWHGPSMTIDTACSSSLVAVHEAVQVLRAGRSRVAIAAGSNLCLAPEPYIAESKLQMLSPTGRSRMWDAKADGYARGDGVGALVLKTLSAALEDGDHIECLIRETGVNQDGRTRGITMPSSTAQTALIRDTYERAGLDLRKKEGRCQYFEAHGTGTPTGDPLEAAAICDAFFPSGGSGNERLYIGSIKTVVGHTEGTAGLAGVLKASLALQNRTIPPNLLFDELNPKIKPFYSNLEIATTAKPWPAVPPGVPRRASVNSFGFGGTNAHAILEAYEASVLPRTDKSQLTFTPFVFSAASEGALHRVLASFAEYLQERGPTVSTRDVSWTLHSRKSRLNFSTVISGATPERLLTNLQTKIGETTDSKQQTPLTIKHQQSPQREKPRVLGVFTGQGAQWATMGREFLSNSAEVRDIVQALDASLQNLPTADRPSWTLFDEFMADGPASRINEAEVSQPMCTAVQIILIHLLRNADVTFDAVVGHSSGEIAAAHAAGFISAEDAIRIAYYRGLCSQLAKGSHGEKGAMMAVGTSLSDVLELCKEPEFLGRINVAAVNSSASVTLSGDAEAIRQAKEVFDEEKKFNRILVVDKAYHSHHMKPCSDQYIRRLHDLRISIRQPSSSSGPTWYSSVREGAIGVTDATDLAGTYWNDNMLNTVLFTQAVESATAGHGPFTQAIEVGPHPALRGPVLQIIQDLLQQSLPYTGTLRRGANDIEAMAESLGYLWQVLPPSSLDLSAYDALLSRGHRPQFIKDLPSYPWDHERIYSFESRVWRATRTRPQACILLGPPCPDGVEQEFRWRNFLSPRELPWLSGHRIQGQIVFPGSGYVSSAVEAAKSMAPNEPIRLVELEDLVIRQAIVFNDESSSVETIVSITDIIHKNKDKVFCKFSFYSSVGKESTVLTLNATGRLIITYGTPNPEILPVNRPPFIDMVDVPGERFYNSLDPIGYGYTGPFRALNGMRRTLGIATGFVNREPTPDFAQHLTLHPAMLDASIQAVLLAKSFPGDGELWCLQVPKVIGRVSVNPALCLSYDPKALTAFQLDAVLTHMGDYDTKGDVDIYSPDGKYTIARMEGVHAVPLEAANSASDRPFFSSMVWGPSTPDPGSLTFDVKARNEDYELAYVLERVSIFYLRRIHLEFAFNHMARREGPYVGLLNFASHVSNLVESGGHRYAQRDWVRDSYSTIMHESQRFPDNIDLAVMHIIGGHMVKVISDQSSILEYLTKDDLLGRYYEQALGIGYFTDYLSRVVAQIVHRYPHMRILEIGAGTGSATKKIIATIGRTFSSYTFTDISSGFFQNARELFPNHKDQMTFKVLDAEKDISSQGFSENSYDLIVASFVLHATSKLENTLSNIRRLLKPGGYLVMLEVTNLEQTRLGYIFGSFPGWWLGAEDGRVLSPCVNTGDWDRLLRRSGFSGVDSVTPDVDTLPFPASAIVSQAMDQTVGFLRDPLGSSANMLNSKTDILVVGGISNVVRDVRNEIIDSLKSRFDHVTVVDNFQELTKNSIPAKCFTLNLSDLDEPVFESITSEKLAALKFIYETSSYLLWITEDSRAGNIHQNQSLGFGRSMTVEMPHVQSQFLDLESINPSSAAIILRAVLRFLAVNMFENPERESTLLWTTEPELAFVNGEEIIPRVRLNKAQNLRYNASRRPISQAVDPRSHVVTVVRDDLTYALEQGSMYDSPDTPPGQKRILVGRSSLQAVRLLSGNDLYLIAGTVVSTGEAVIGFSASNSSVVDAPNNWLVPTRNCSPAQLLPFAVAHAISRSIVSSIYNNKVLIVTEPDKIISSALEFHASQKGLRIIFLTSGEKSKRGSRIVLHPHTHTRSMQKILPEEPATVLDMSSGVGGSSLALELRSALHPSSSFEHISSFFSDSSRYFEDHVAAETMQMISLCQHQQMTTIGHIEQEYAPLNDITGMHVGQPGMSFIDWTYKSPVYSRIRPIGHYTLLRGDKTYWLVGLTGSLGLSLCQWMVRHGAQNVVLTSRNPKINPSALQELRSSGARVEIYAGDVTNLKSLRSVYDRICQTLPPIAGVAQGAMVLQDTLVKDMDVKAMENVLKPKVTGSIHLDELFSHSHPLDFFIFFSSATCVTGNIGQSNYAAANMFMTALAANRKRRGLSGSVINIGAIMGVGYVTRETSEALQRNLLKSGHIWMSEGDFHTLFAEAILTGSPGSNTNPEITCGLRIVNQTDEQRPLWSYSPKFQHLVVPEGISVDSDSGHKKQIPLKLQLIEASTADQIYKIVQDSFISKLQTMLGLQDMAISAICDKGADDLGIDSLNTVEIRSWFLKELKVDIPVLRILGGATIGDIVRFVFEKLPSDLTPNLGIAAMPPNHKSALGQTSDTQHQSPRRRPINGSELSNSIGDIVQVEHNKDEFATSTESESARNRFSKRSNNDSSVAVISQENSTTAESFLIINTPQLSEDEKSVSLQNGTGKLPLSEKPRNADLSVLRKEPLSFAQSRFWFLRLYLEDQTTFNITCLMRIEGPLSIDSLENAVRVVGERHEALRTCFSAKNGESPMQTILEHSTLTLERNHYRTISDVEAATHQMKTHVYDIEHGQLMRMLLLYPTTASATPQVHYLIIGYHHINMDGVSLEVILSDLTHVYQRQPLRTPVLQFPDFASKQRQDQSTGLWSEDLLFWKNEFTNTPPEFPLLPLTTVVDRKPLLHYGHHRVQQRLDKNLGGKIRHICQVAKSTPSHFYLAVFTTLLCRLADTQSVCIGMADANRIQAEAADGVGLYLNLLALNMHYDSQATFLESIRVSRKKTYSALAHSQVPFDVLLTELQVPRSPTVNPLFQVFMDYRRDVREKRMLGESRFEGLDYEMGRTPYDIALDIVDNAEREPLIIMGLQKSLYSEDAAQTLLNTFLNMVTNFANNSSIPIGQVPMFAAEDIEKSLILGRGPIMPSKWPATLSNRVDTMVQRFPKKLALNDGSNRPLTFEAMGRRADSIASALLSANVGRAQRVGVFQHPSTDWICSMLAVLRVGATYVPLDLRLEMPRLKLICGDAKPTILLVDNETKDQVDELACVDALRINICDLPISFPIPVVNRSVAEDPAVILYTSGSTGTPKGIALTHENLRVNIEGNQEEFRLWPHDHLLQQIAFSFDFSVWQVFMALSNAASLYICPISKRGDPVALTDLIITEGITITGATPSEYNSWFRHGDLSRLRDSKWRTAASAGEAMTSSMLDDFRLLNKRDLRLFNGYGPTEASMSSNKLQVPYYLKKQLLTDKFMHEGVVLAGYTAPNYSIYIVDDDLQPVPTGIPGQILIGGPGIAVGYLNNEEMSSHRFQVDRFATAEQVSQGWRRVHLTGDRGRLCSDGQLRIEGRIDGDTQIKLRGYRVDLRDIETAIRQKAQHVLKEAVVTLHHASDTSPETLIAHVNFRPDYPAEQRRGFLRNLSKSLPLPRYMWPSMVIPIDEMPVTAHGKLDRRALGARSIPQSDNDELADNTSKFTETETRLAEQWQAVISKNIVAAHHLEPDSDFFAIGGNSMLLVELQRRIKTCFDLDIHLVQLFEASTVRKMALLLQPSDEPEPPVAHIAWSQEIQLPSHLQEIPALSLPTKQRTRREGLHVILSGATGFIGRALLQRLVEDPGVAIVHCIAVRSNSAHQPPLVTTGKIIVHHGDLGLPKLGLSEQQAAVIFQEADAVIHNGADVSFLKTYQSLRRTNVDATIELLQLALPRRVPFHYISTSGIANLAGVSTFPEVSAASFTPPVDGSQGYLASKWASERVLEQANRTFDLPIWIHRPSSVTGKGSSPLDLMDNLMEFSRRLRAVPLPERSSWQGYLNFVPVEQVVSDILQEVLQPIEPSSLNQVRYIHHLGENIPLHGVQKYLEKETGVPYRALSMEAWLKEAEEKGLDKLLIEYLGKMDTPGVKVMFPRLVARPKQQLPIVDKCHSSWLSRGATVLFAW